jgi:hypothetical protein
MIYFIYFVFKWVQRTKVFKWCSKISFKWSIHLNCEKIQTKSIVSKSLFKGIFLLVILHSKRIFKSLQNPSLIEFKSQHPVISLVSIVIKVFLYQKWHLTSEAILVSIFLSFFSVYSIYPSTPPHVSRSHLHMKYSRCTIISPFNQPIISGLVIHDSFPPHSREAPSTLPISSVQPLSRNCSLFSMI